MEGPIMIAMGVLVMLLGGFVYVKEREIRDKGIKVTGKVQKLKARRNGGIRAAIYAVVEFKTKEGVKQVSHCRITPGHKNCDKGNTVEIKYLKKNPGVVQFSDDPIQYRPMVAALAIGAILVLYGVWIVMS